MTNVDVVVIVGMFLLLWVTTPQFEYKGDGVFIFCFLFRFAVFIALSYCSEGFLD